MVIDMTEILTAGILTIGNEVLDGLVVDTNANWMELRLVALGVKNVRLACVRDDIGEIGRGLDFLLETCDLILTSGGLGPTHDDMTLAAIAQRFELPMCENPEALAIVKRQYQILFERGIVESPEITDSRRKMAIIPEGALPLDNRVGGAPGVKLSIGKAIIFCLPGVPSELKFIFENSVIPWIKENVSSSYVEKVVYFPIRDETMFAPHIDPVMKKHKGVYIKSMPATYGTSNVLKVWVSARGENDSELHDLVESAIASLEEATGLKTIEPMDNI